MTGAVREVWRKITIIIIITTMGGDMVAASWPPEHPQQRQPTHWTIDIKSLHPFEK